MRCTRKIEFDAGHRVIGHKHKCKYVHGHRFILEVTLESEELNEIGMVMDFGNMKHVLKSWIDDNFDHTLILHKADKNMGDAITQYTGQKIYYLDNNPTAENIAMHLKVDILPKLFDSKVFAFSVKLSETPNCFVAI